MSENEKAILLAFEEMFSRQSASIAVTLTFKPRLRAIKLTERTLGIKLNEYYASDAIRMFLRRLNYAAYDHRFKRKEKQLEVLAVREGHSSGIPKHLHYHLSIEIPSGWTANEWCDEAMKAWKKIEWASEDQNTFTPARDAGWNSYVLKPLDKFGALESVDVMNCWLNPKES